MPIDVVLDHPDRYLARGPREAAQTVLGALLLLTGIVASVPAVVLALPALAFVQSVVDPAALQADSSVAELPLGLLAILWLASTAIAIIAGMSGLRILRGERQVVVFLRRFGFDDATNAVTSAASSSMGRWWRLVTLDDDEVSAIGVDAGTRRLVALAGFGSILAKAGFRVGVVIARVVGVAWMILGGIVLIDALSEPDVGEALLLALTRYLTLLTDTIDAGHLVQPFGPDLNTAFVILAAISAVVFIGAIVAVPILLLSLPLMIPLGFITETIDSVRKAEASRTRVINSSSQVAAAAASIASDSRGIFAPRLVVLTVATAAWQETVRKLAAVSSAILIDISEPTENLVWEIRELMDDFGSRFVVVGEYSRVRGLEESTMAEPGSPAAQLRSLLDGRQVIAYTTDRRGRRRFAKALRNTLDALTPVAVSRRELPRIVVR